MPQRFVLADGVLKSTATASIDSNLTVGLVYRFDDDQANSYLVYNDSSSQLVPTKGVTVAPATQSTGYSVTLSSISGESRLCGVPHTSINSNAYGWVLARGYKSGLAAASAVVSAGAECILAANGIFSQAVNTSGVTGATGAGTHPRCGMIVSTTTAARGSLDAFFVGMYG